ncbi:DMT family transporter [Tengunoibacter tsumagoiensis]|uniref:EamA domain-containing protein n=1 Tax=Tengunoibacter tsumagoiensis TaxID=2014871 RepID=A0A401ZXJ1_9CHLR|nr:DMT family transporter [Tengunoibacter tsumagoiensis]GCE11557.1 hypothetical protein KTT_14160 [Tengunoibacter tsumagoiensis]
MKVQRTDLAVLGASLLWGFNYTSVKIALFYLTPFMLGLLRFAIASIAMVCLLRSMEGSIRVTWPAVRRMIVASLVGFGAQQICFLYGSHFIDASMVALLTAFTTAFMVILTSIASRERLNFLMLFGVGVACLGVLGVVLGKKSALMLSSQSLLGFALVIGSGILAGTAPLINRRTLMSYSSSRVTTWTIIFGSCFFFPLGAASGNGSLLMHLPWQAWIAILFSALGGTAGANLLWNYGIAHIGVVRMTIYSYLAPLLGMLLASFLLNEGMTPLQWVGALITLVGIAISQYGKLVSTHRLTAQALDDHGPLTDPRMGIVGK